MFAKKNTLFILLLLFPWIGLSAQQIVDSCLTSISVGTSFAGNGNISNRNADCVNWTGTTWTGDWAGANLTLAPPGSVPGTRGIWMGDGSVWTTGGEGFGMRLNAPMLLGITYNFEFTRVSHGTGSTGNFAPILYTNNGGILGTMVGPVAGVGSAWTTGIISLTAGAANNGHTWIYFNAQSGGVGSGMFLACGNAVILPMELRTFDGWAEPDGNHLRWEMYNEEGYVSHRIDRSPDGATFLEIGSVPSSGSDDLTSYSYRDASPGTMAVQGQFYRIRSLLANGEEAISPVVEIRRTEKTEYLHRVWPNPLNSDRILNIEFVAGSQQSAGLRMRDALGREVLTRSADLETGLNHLQWDVSNLSTGVYLLEVQTSQGRAISRIVID
jgi:hypothetical protein